MMSITDAGAVEPLVALLVSPAVGVQQAAAQALYSLALNGTITLVSRRAVESRMLCHVPHSRE